jgi:hypothetical protein
MTEPIPPVDWVGSDKVSQVGTFEYSGMTLVGWKVELACRFPGSGDGPCQCDPAKDWQCVPPSQSAMAHEFFHWKCWLDTGDVDLAHSHCDWNQVSAAQDGYANQGGDHAGAVVESHRGAL